jgi:hypothetical protein
LTLWGHAYLSFRLDVLNALGCQILKSQVPLQMLAKLLRRRVLGLLRFVLQIERTRKAHRVRLL